MNTKNRFGLYPNGEPDTEAYYAEWAEQEYGSGNAFLLPDIKEPPDCDLTAGELLVSDEDSPSYDYEDYDDREFSFAEELDNTEMRRLGISPSATPETAGSNRRAKRLSELASQVVADGRLLLSDSGLAFIYQTDQGCYLPTTGLHRYIAGVLGDDTASDLLERDVKEIVAKLSWNPAICCSLDDFDQHPELVNLANGVLNIKTGELIPHDAAFRFTYAVQADYLRDAEDIACPEFENFCQTSLDGDSAKRQLLLEFIGYICANTNDGKCGLFLKGQPNSGKSVALEFITSLFDSSVISNIQLHDLGDKFGRAELAGKKLNSAGEIAGRTLHDISVFKAITGSDRIEAEFKGKNHFRFSPRCKFLFSGNTLPYTSERDATNAFVNRIRVLLFNQSIPPGKQDKCLGNKLWTERNSIVTHALHAAQKLIERNYEFTLPEDSRQFLKSFELRGNVLASFIDDCCVLDPEARTFNVDLYAAFEAFSERNGLKALSREKFYELLSGLPHVTLKRLRIGAENRWGHTGIALKDRPQ